MTSIELDGGASLLPSHDTFKERLKRALYGRAWFAGLAVLLVLSVASFAIFLANESRKEPWFVALEASLNVALLVEVSLRLYAFGVRDWMNILDIIICVSCMGAFILYVLRTEDGVVFTVLLAARYSVQFVRVLLFYRKRVEFNRAQDTIVDFSSVPATPQNVFED